MLNETIWNSIRANRALREVAPPWLRPLLEKSFIGIQELPLPTNTPTADIIFRPTLELDEITPSYLGFLKTQIQLEPRGKEWTEILKARFNALVPYEHEKLYRLSVLRTHESRAESFFVRFHPGDLRMVHSECSC